MSGTRYMVQRLPLLVGFGGYNAAGRSSGHLGYKRMVFESLSPSQQRKTCLALASIMGLDASADGGEQEYKSLERQVLEGTLVRRIETSLFNPDKVPTGRVMALESQAERPAVFKISARELPDPLPDGWQIQSTDGGGVTVAVSGRQTLQIEREQALPVQSAGQLPTGFDPGRYYRSTHHPRGLQLAVMGASDAVQSMGVDWGEIAAKVAPDEVAVFSSSVMSQLDVTGFGGMLKARQQGGRVTSKQLALGLNTMPADFINAYVLGSVGVTGGVTGACATFLYNLRAGVEEIKSGRCRVAVVGSSEAPILPEVIDGYAAMSALATDAELMKLDGAQRPNYRRASRPFGNNCGFVLAESGQYAVLMDDELALELGAVIHAAVPGVYINADGFKKSISSPGAGNYITMAKSVALARGLLGDDVVRRSSFVQAHGSSTPQNRVTESRIFDATARAFGIEQWPVAAVKAYLGHSLGPASGDQLMASLGVFSYGILPGIKTIDGIAEDVSASRLSLSSADLELGVDAAQVAFLNSKGFGGNNATATVLAPGTTHRLMLKRHGQAAWQAYQARRERAVECADAYQRQADRGALSPRYIFGEGIINEAEIELNPEQLSLPDFEHSVSLTRDEGFDDLCE